MRLAVSLESNQGLDSMVAHHFGRCPYFALLMLEGDQVQSCQVIENPYYAAHQPGQVPGFIKEQGADVMISSGMGRRAIRFFEDFGIEAVTGAGGTVRETLDRYLDGKLSGAAPCKESVEHEHGRGKGHGGHQHHHE